MNPLLLSEWLPACERAGVPIVPVNVGPSVAIDEIQRAVEGLGRTPSLDKARRWLESHGAPPSAMWRWDCCAAPDLKDEAEEGFPSGAPRIDMDLDDERLLALLEQLEEDDEDEIMVMWRPWVKAKREGDFPVEFRAFVTPAGIAVSNYHPTASLPQRYVNDAVTVAQLAERLAKTVKLPSFTADFILSEAGELLFLEGGPGWERRGAVSACCFDGEPRPGMVALSARSVKPLKTTASKATTAASSDEDDESAASPPPPPAKPTKAPAAKAPSPRAVKPPPVKLAHDKVEPPPKPARRTDAAKAAAARNAGPVPTGKVGIFWLNKGKLVVFGEPAAELASVAGQRDSRFTYDDQWENVQAMYPELLDTEYFELPHGRVLFCDGDGRYEIYMPAKLHGLQKLVIAVSRAFGIPAESVRLRRDDEYEVSLLASRTRPACPMRWRPLSESGAPVGGQGMPCPYGGGRRDNADAARIDAMTALAPRFDAMTPPAPRFDAMTPPRVHVAMTVSARCLRREGQPQGLPLQGDVRMTYGAERCDIANGALSPTRSPACVSTR